MIFSNNSIVYNNGEIELSIPMEDETIWATTKDIANIFNIDRSVVSRHIKNIFKDGELDEKVVCANFAHTTQHGALSNKTQTRELKYYNLVSKNQDIQITIYTKTISKQLKLDLDRYNAQYKPITIKKFNLSHDRFLIIDKEEVYHIGASLKDLGKKWFAFNKMDKESIAILEKLK